MLETSQRDRDFRGGVRIETDEPVPKRTAPGSFNINEYFHSDSIIYVTNYGKRKAAIR